LRNQFSDLLSLQRYELFVRVVFVKLGAKIHGVNSWIISLHLHQLFISIVFVEYGRAGELPNAPKDQKLMCLLSRPILEVTALVIFERLAAAGDAGWKRLELARRGIQRYQESTGRPPRI
jgi:hypothetical protein